MWGAWQGCTPFQPRWEGRTGCRMQPPGLSLCAWPLRPDLFISRGPFCFQFHCSSPGNFRLLFNFLPAFSPSPVPPRSPWPAPAPLCREFLLFCPSVRVSFRWLPQHLLLSRHYPVGSLIIWIPSASPFNISPLCPAA